MSSFDELTFKAPPVSMSTIERIGHAVRDALGLEHELGPIQWLPLIDVVLPKMGILVYPVHAEELEGDEGDTDPSGNGYINILLPESTYEDLGDFSRRGNRARATMPHELSHAVMHVPVVRRYRNHPNADRLLRRQASSALKPYERAEWQAWALAGCIVAPRYLVAPTVHAVSSRDATLGLAAECGVSEVFMTNHLRRLKLIASSRELR